MNTATTASRARHAAPKPHIKKPQDSEASVADYFKDEKHLAKLLDDHKQMKATLAELTAYAQQDHATASVEVTYGEALYNILKLPIDAQKNVVFAIADYNGVPHPKYPKGPKQRGRQPSGRKQLAEAQYGLWPEMLKLEGKNKDTRAGMQITDHVRRFRIRAGLMEQRATKAQGGVPRRTLKKSFEVLFVVAKSDREMSMLRHLFERLGIEQQDLTKWEHEAKPEEKESAA